MLNADDEVWYICMYVYTAYCRLRVQEARGLRTGVLRKIYYSLCYSDRGAVYCLSDVFNKHRSYLANILQILTNQIWKTFSRTILSIGKTVENVVFEFIANEQTDRRGGGICFTICSDNHKFIMIIVNLSQSTAMYIYVCATWLKFFS